MQKKILSLAVAGALAAPAVALAQVEVYGTIAMSLNKMKYGEGTGGVPSVSKWDVASHASNVGVRGRENIGGGQTAWFQVETNASMERSNNVAHTSNFASRNSAVGLQGGWGNLFLGQWTTPWADLDALWSVGTVATYGPVTTIIGRRETTGAAPNPNCNNNFSGNGGVGLPPVATPTTVALGTCDSVEAGGGVGHPFWRRISNSVFYQSPVFGGAQVKLAYQTNQDKASVAVTGGALADPQMYSAAVSWSGMGGRLRIGAAYDGHKDFTTVGQTDKGWRVTGGWNFGIVDIGAAYEEMTYKTTIDNEAKQWGVAIAIPIGQGAIRAAYSQADDIDRGAATVDDGAKQYNIGYDYRFSKRTQVGFGYATIDNGAAAVFTWSGLSSTQGGQAVTPAAGSDVDIFFVSVIHRF